MAEISQEQLRSEKSDSGTAELFGVLFIKMGTGSI